MGTLHAFTNKFEDRARLEQSFSTSARFEECIILHYLAANARYIEEFVYNILPNPISEERLYLDALHEFEETNPFICDSELLDPDDFGDILLLRERYFSLPTDVKDALPAGVMKN